MWRAHFRGKVAFGAHQRRWNPTASMHEDCSNPGRRTNPFRIQTRPKGAKIVYGDVKEAIEDAEATVKQKAEQGEQLVLEIGDAVVSTANKAIYHPLTFVLTLPHPPQGGEGREEVPQREQDCERRQEWRQVYSARCEEEPQESKEGLPAVRGPRGVRAFPSVHGFRPARIPPPCMATPTPPLARKRPHAHTT
jgi:hypothetical protein